jgi:hypothetical protein
MDMVANLIARGIGRGGVELLAEVSFARRIGSDFEEGRLRLLERLIIRRRQRVTPSA